MILFSNLLILSLRDSTFSGTFSGGGGLGGFTGSGVGGLRGGGGDSL